METALFVFVLKSIWEKKSIKINSKKLNEKPALSLSLSVVNFVIFVEHGPDFTYGSTTLKAISRFEAALQH